MRLSSKLLLVGIVALPVLAGFGSAQAQGYPPPPVARQEVVPPPPGPPEAYAWRPGYWSWNGARYVWVRGRYYHPPRPRAEWVPAHWAQRQGAWVWVQGHWH